jgi:alginate O-acetyltransferase complex protein AlgI
MESAVSLSHYLGFQANVHTLQVILPVGISFYTFQTLSYTIDVYRKKIPVCNSKLDFALFVAFFPQLVAGPIVRAADFLPQLKHNTVLAEVRFRPALWLFTAGFIKKACVADNIATYVDAFYQHPTSFDAISAWIATVLYAIQIYCDFSGYSDIAIACAAMLGYQLCINFKHPYFATNVTEFWHRWHMSLSTWLRDYLYIPLGGNRGTPLQTERNLMVTMLLGGLWHGASWNFVMWGGIHGVALIAHKYWQKYLTIEWGRFPAVTLFLSTLLTFSFVNFCWVFFRARNFSDSLLICGKLIGISSAHTQQLPMSLLLVIAAFFITHYVEYKSHMTGRISTWAPFKTAVILAVTWALIMQFLPLAANPFIYFQF